MKSVVITGSSRGIGLGIAREFLGKDCRVVLSARRKSKLEEEVEKLSIAFDDSRVIGQPCDVTDSTQVQALWDAAKEKFGRVDVWINNAGMYATTVPLWELDTAEIAPVVNTNLTGLIYGCQVAVNGMIEQGSGQIYNFEGFGSNDMIRDGLSIYGATKRAVRYFTDALIEETRETPVQVGTLNPGIVMTDLLLNDMRRMSPENLEMIKITFNALGDKVETVTPFLVEEMLKNTQTGVRIQWLTKEKINERFEDDKYLERDLVGEFGL